jgi:nucleoside-diphosphate kinase
MAYEHSFNLAKPDAIERRLLGKIISRFEEKGLVLVDMKYVRPTERQIRLMYEDNQTYAIFDEILAYLVDKPVIAMVWAGEDASAKGRQLVGAKEPLDSEAGTIRGSMADDRVRNLVHGSRTGEEAFEEMKIFFPERWPGTPVPAAARPAAEAPKEVATERAWSWDGASEAEMESVW